MRTGAHQAHLFEGFSRQEYWSGLSFPSPEDLPYPVIKPRSPALQADSLPSEPPGKPSSAAVSWNLQRHSRVLAQILQTDHGWAPIQTASRKPGHWQQHIIVIISIMAQPCHTRTSIYAYTHTNTHTSEILPKRLDLQPSPVSFTLTDTGLLELASALSFRILIQAGLSISLGYVLIITFWPQTLQCKGQTTKTKQFKYPQTTVFIGNTF